MENYSQPPPGKISEHGNGIGAPSREEVERRAREIAMIDERNPDEFTEADWAQARHELMGEENNVPPRGNSRQRRHDGRMERHHKLQRSPDTATRDRGGATRRCASSHRRPPRSNPT